MLWPHEEQQGWQELQHKLGLHSSRVPENWYAWFCSITDCTCFVDLVDQRKSKVATLGGCKFLEPSSAKFLIIVGNLEQVDHGLK